MTNEQLIARIKAHENVSENMLQLWNQNKGLIYAMAKKYCGYAELEDFVQEGYLGMCEAVRHYENEKSSFSSYVTFWIIQRMQRYVYKTRTIYVPENMQHKIMQYNRLINEYKKYYGKTPSDKEMRSLLDVNQTKFEEIKRCVLAMQVKSLDEPIQEFEEDIVLCDTLASDENMEEDVIKELDAAAMKESLWKAVDNLDHDLAAVIRKRYQDNMTLKEVGESMGVSTERARQVERNAIRKLRIPSKCAPFKCYFEQYLAAGPIYHVGINEFNRTWTSSVEAEALGW